MSDFPPETLILASASPRRAELLQRLKVPHRIYPVDVDETLTPNIPAEQLAELISQRKLQQALSELGKNQWILTADTFLIHEGQYLGKPADMTRARMMLNNLSGKTHQVITGCTLYSPLTQQILSKTELTSVCFRTLSPKDLKWYLATEEWQGAAGGYRIQEQGECLVFSINGSYSNVMGLPLGLIYGMLCLMEYALFAK